MHGTIGSVHNWLYTQDAPQQALTFLRNQISVIEPQVYRIEYPEIQYPLLVPVDTSLNEWAKSVTFFSLDSFGKANWFHHNAKDVPIADITREKFEQGIEMAAIGYRYTLEELGQAMMIPGTNLTGERADAARRAYEEFVDDVALRGSTDKGWYGVINQPSVAVIDALADGDLNGGTNSPYWAHKSDAQIIRDFNAALTNIYTASLTIEMADTVLLPISLLNLLAERGYGETTMTLLEWINKYNTYTMQTKRPITIRVVRGLETASADDDARMVVYRRDPAVLKMHIPMPHRFLDVWRTGPMIYDVPGIFRLGGVEVRRPAAMRYVDNIAAAPA